MFFDTKFAVIFFVVTLAPKNEEVPADIHQILELKTKF